VLDPQYGSSTDANQAWPFTIAPESESSTIVDLARMRTKLGRLP